MVERALGSAAGRDGGVGAGTSALRVAGARSAMPGPETGRAGPRSRAVRPGLLANKRPLAAHAVNEPASKPGRVAGAMSRPYKAKSLGTCSSMFSTPGCRAPSPVVWLWPDSKLTRAL